MKGKRNVKGRFHKMIFGSYDKNVKIVLSEMDVTYD